MQTLDFFVWILYTKTKAWTSAAEAFRSGSSQDGSCPQVYSSLLWIILIQTERLQSAVGNPAAGGKAMRFYRSPKWEHKRAKILRRDGYLCQISKRYGKTVPADTVHHIFPRDEFPEYQLSDWNLISLSASVHDTMHDRTSGKLSPAGAELLRRTCRKYGKEIPDQYKE